MIPGRSIETVQPCGIVVRSSDGVVDLCLHCAMDCPSRGHERTCRGGCSECTCVRHGE